jgi:putative ABC transport system permease protein
MRLLHELRYLIRKLNRGRAEQELEEEIRAHLELETREKIEAGLTPEEARCAARREFGSVALASEESRAAWGFLSVETFVRDVRYGVRVLMRQPGLCVVVVLTLALGIGANTAIFSVVNAVLLRPLPYRDPSRLAVVWTNNTRAGNPKSHVAAANFADLRDRNNVFEEAAAFLAFTPTMSLTGLAEPMQVTQSMVSTNLFPMLGADPAAGRTFLPEEAHVGKDDVVILSYGLWQRAFGGSPGIVGQALTISGYKYTVVGIMRPEFYFLFRNVDIWLPLSFNTRFNPNNTATNRSAGALGVIGRLKPGITLEQARADLSAIALNLEQEYPQTNTGLGITLVPLHEQVTGEVRTALLVLLGAVSFVLLIACANVATLLLARSASRKKEMAIRTALGAGRARLMRQLLTESVLLSIIGGAIGLMLAVWGIDIILSLSPAEIPRQSEIGIDLWVLAFASVISVATGIVFGIAPALQASGTEPGEAMKEGGRAVASQTGQKLRSALVVSEIALTLVLLIGAGLLIRSFARLMQVSPGFNPNNVLTVGVSLPRSQGTPPAEATAFYGELFERIEAIPGVESVGAVTRLPLTAAGVSTNITIEGRALPVAERPEVEFRRASRDYFRALGIPVLKGRSFDEQERPGSPSVVVINEAAARLFWPDEDPVGKRIKTIPNPDAPWSTIIGVVGDVRHFGLDTEPRPELYISFDQAPPFGPLLVIRTTRDPLSVVGAVRAQIQSMNRDQPLGSIQTMGQILDTSVAARRFNMLLLGLFAGLALALAGVGIYGVTSYSVSQRTHEIGIRMAFGASPSNVLGLILGQGLRLVIAGMAIGLGVALAITRIISSLLFGIGATDPVTFSAISLLLAGVAMLACYVPARRATKVDPMISLRYE